MKVLITGGAGFIGVNAAARFIQRGHEVVVLDNLSRPRVDSNLAWLRTQGSFAFHQEDIRNRKKLEQVFAQHPDTQLILHLAGQVAVTSSVTDPRADFEINAFGTFNVLEAIRQHLPKAACIFSSTNKVYGGCEDVSVVERAGRYAFDDLPLGVPEERPLDFHSPYGCSKGAADQYVRDYHRIYGLNTVVFRQSCISGYRQFGLEDQGWVAWFMIATQLGKPIAIYGDGKQVRDILFIDDLVDAFEAAAANIQMISGKIYNLGGGPDRVFSLLELVAYLEKRLGRPVPFKKDAWRPGDQKVYVSDIRKAKADFGWEPKHSLTEGLDRLYDWVAANVALFK